MNTELLTRVQQINPATSDDSIPAGVWSAEQVLEKLQHRAVTPVPLSPRPSRPWLIAAAVAVVVLIVIGGLGVLTRDRGTDVPPVINQPEPTQTTSPESSPTTLREATPTTVLESAPTTLPESTTETTLPRTTIPRNDSSSTGSLSTPQGQAEWTRIPGDGNPRPLYGSEAIEWPSGFAMFHPPNFLGPAQLLISDDGTDWRTQPIPLSPTAERASLSLVQGVYWLISTNPNGLWRSTNGLTWEEFDPVLLATPGPTGLDWIGAEHSPPVTVGELTLLHASFTAAFPFAEYAGPNTGACERLVELRPEVFGMVADEGTCPSPVVRFVETATGLQVIDDSTNAHLGEIDGANLIHIERFVKLDELHEESLLIIGDGEIIQVQVPWEDVFNTVTLLGTTDWFYAYVQSYSGGQDGSSSTTVWRSSDGRSWTNHGTPSFLVDAPQDDATRFTALSGVVAATTRDLPIAAWETTDGIAWTPVPEGRPPLTNPVRLESGWFANDGSRGGPDDGDAWWMHVDGEWVSLTELGMEHLESGCVVGTTAIETTTFFLGGDCFPTTDPDLWFLSLPDTQ